MLIKLSYLKLTANQNFSSFPTGVWRLKCGYGTAGLQPARRSSTPVAGKMQSSEQLFLPERRW